MISSLGEAKGAKIHSSKLYLVIAKNIVSIFSKSKAFRSTTFLNVGGGRVYHAPSLGYDNLDGCIGRLHTNFQISATLSKKVLIFSQKGYFSR